MADGYYKTHDELWHDSPLSREIDPGTRAAFRVASSLGFQAGFNAARGLPWDAELPEENKERIDFNSFTQSDGGTQ